MNTVNAFDGSDAAPLVLLCEHPGCRKKATADCRRMRPPWWARIVLFLMGYRMSDWAHEPIALCEEHSQGRKVLHRYTVEENPEKPCRY